MPALVTNAPESLQNGFERLWELHEAHIGKFYARRQTILIRRAEKMVDAFINTGFQAGERDRM
jgi:hypothetical protein